ncbi:hypothetical protein MLD38_039451 [Melastoma candidum]|uniref:Uncharacterized protein n=1 Tax=Melastoma candidum TaxID=119954 RepID=A0ACB9L2V0_9MYRT|nr:hypothetical protein MLD38_039451 [Melastoma candidum]
MAQPKKHRALILAFPASLEEGRCLLFRRSAVESGVPDFESNRAGSASLGAVGSGIMFLSRVFGRTFLAAAARAEASAGSTAASAAVAGSGHNPLEAFFEADRSPDDDQPVVYGRSWKASELRLKSWDDLHKLWYVLLKEKNMLMTQRQMLHAQNLRFPNPERLPKVRKSMCRIKHVLTERAIDEPDSRRSAEMKRMVNAL